MSRAKNILNKFEATMFIYGMNLRPPGIGSAPKGFKVVKEKTDDFRHGTVSYSKPLSDKELNNFQMTPIGDGQLKRVKERVIKKMGKYLDKYLENEDALEDFVRIHAFPEEYAMRLPRSDFEKLLKEIKKGK